jgi:hypothetical protein
MLLVMTLVPFLVLRNSKSSLTTPFSCFCSWIRLTADIRIIGGGLPVSQEVFPYTMLPHCWYEYNPCPFQLCGVGRKITCGDLLLWGAYGGRRSGRHCCFRSRGGFGGAVPLPLPDFLEAFLLCWLLTSFACRV